MQELSHLVIISTSVEYLAFYGLHDIILLHFLLLKHFEFMVKYQSYCIDDIIIHDISYNSSI